MSRTRARPMIRSTYRTRRAPLSPYFLGDVAFIRAAILRDRGLNIAVVKRPSPGSFTTSDKPSL
jgi:hypothetical protein